MKVVIMTVGSRGDVVPFLGLGVRLREAGHDVTVATQASSAAAVRDCGLEFRPLPGDMRQELASAEGRRWARSGTGPRGFRAQMQVGQNLMRGMGEAVVAAAMDADVLLLQRFPAMHGYLAARAHGIPSIGLELTPGVPTGDFLPPMFGNRSLGRWANRNGLRLVGWMPTPFDRTLKDFQTRLGVSVGGLMAVRRAMLDDPHWPILHGFSPTIVPRPADWRSGVEVVGYWWPPHPPPWEPPAELVDFLEAGPPPVFVGFGSLAQGEGERLSEIVTSALRRARVRAVVQAGWAEVSGAGDDVLNIGSVPHDWLFPRMAAVVHHAGAGTTGATLRAGVPAVPVPILYDQPFWAARLVRLGVSPGVVPFKRLSAERLATLIRQAVSEPSYRHRAETVADRVRAEDGAGRVAEVLEQITPNARPPG